MAFAPYHHSALAATAGISKLIFAMQGVEIWDVKQAVFQQVFTSYLRAPDPHWRETQAAVYFWRNKFRDVIAELHQMEFFFYDRYLGAWFNLKKVHGALGAQ